MQVLKVEVHLLSVKVSLGMTKIFNALNRLKLPQIKMKTQKKVRPKIRRRRKRRIKKTKKIKKTRKRRKIKNQKKINLMLFQLGLVKAIILS